MKIKLRLNILTVTLGLLLSTSLAGCEQPLVETGAGANVGKKQGGATPRRWAFFGKNKTQTISLGPPKSAGAKRVKGAPRPKLAKTAVRKRAGKKFRGKGRKRKGR